MEEKATIGSGWALVQKNTILHYGLDPEKLYREQGLELKNTSDPDYRFPAEPFNKIWYRIESETNAPDVGLTAANFVLPTTFHALGMALWSSCNLADALSRLVRYSRIFHNGGSASIEQRADGYGFILTRKTNAQGVSLVTDIGLDCLFYALLKLFRQLSGNNFTPKLITFKRPEPSNLKQYQDVFACPLKFSAENDAIFMDQQTYYADFPAGNAQIAGMNDNIADQYLARFDREDIVSQIKQIVIKDLTTGEVTQESVARELAMSVRSLQRVLKQKETGFKEVLDNTKKELANYYIVQKNLSLGEIGYLLGFSAVNNFSRTFKRWYGMSPAKYREQLRNKAS
ncbi:AraC family transcriptional regulator [Thalassotalea sp. LPB0316]|uniref:AraC family transcriptional regulator n=1 Tax=Thalassotalea sp. LPB0316 TaxID=2769490 RepID=UPI001866AFC5|nr:AraC family transcriptional regulator [Thalassotalea sp. LPB0316]QOL25141.1 AraC family transcriptional regulator [Thalassotalea sp. LPB0316]